MEASIRHFFAALLQEYRDVFGFGPEEIHDIDLAVMEHKLNIDPTYKPVIQNRQHMGPEWTATATVEV